MAETMRAAVRCVTVVGARPQFVKAAVVSDAMAREGRIEEVVVHTGQHYDDSLSGVFFRELGLRAPRYNLGVGSGTHAEQTAGMLTGLERVVVDERPDIVLVYGDTNSTLAGALVAAKLRVPLAHVEAGMRSWNRRMPEEINRVVTDHLAELHLCASQRAVENLAAEGVVAGVHLVGDVMYDAVLRFRPAAARLAIPCALPGHGARGYVLATCHRAENADDPTRLSAIADALVDVSAAIPVVFPVHPRVSRVLGATRISGCARVCLLPPLSYLEMLKLEAGAAAVVTDSGGVQKEAFYLQVPCVTIREETEWPETVACGANALAGSDRQRIVELVHAAMRSARSWSPAGVYGHGRAAVGIAGLLAEPFGKNGGRRA